MLTQGVNRSKDKGREVFWAYLFAFFLRYEVNLQLYT